MQPAHPYRFKEQQFWLSPDRCIYWEDEGCLILSDLHLGKTGHFRKSGIAVPQSVYKEDLQRLLSQIQYFRPRQVIVVGDLCHSRENRELDLFRKWRDDLPDLTIRLIRGNHDILEDSWYERAGIVVNPESWQLGDFTFVHDIADLPEGAGYAFSGHIHPGVRISGLGRQALQFPCFYFGGMFAVLPAFSRFTGMVSIDADPSDNVFAILPPERGGSAEMPLYGRRERQDTMTRPGIRYGSGSIFQVQ